MAHDFIDMYVVFNCLPSYSPSLLKILNTSGKRVDCRSNLQNTTSLNL
jgi:hypothetical protein